MTVTVRPSVLIYDDRILWHLAAGTRFREPNRTDIDPLRDPAEMWDRPETTQPEHLSEENS